MCRGPTSAMCHVSIPHNNSVTKKLITTCRGLTLAMCHVSFLPKEPCNEGGDNDLLRMYSSDVRLFCRKSIRQTTSGKKTKRKKMIVEITKEEKIRAKKWRKVTNFKFHSLSIQKRYWRDYVSFAQVGLTGKYIGLILRLQYIGVCKSRWEKDPSSLYRLFYLSIHDVLGSGSNTNGFLLQKATKKKIKI